MKNIINIAICSFLILSLFFPLANAVDEEQKSSKGYWKTVPIKVYITSPWWHGFFGGHIDGCDQYGWYYWDTQRVWVPPTIDLPP